MPKIVKLVPNQEDELHCFQACFTMVVEAFTGDELPMSKVEELTNFYPGRPTWVYKGMLSWANLGLYVKYVEIVDQEAFSKDPESSIQAQMQDELLAQQIIDVSDLPKEAQYVTACLAHPNITFEVRQPSIDDIEKLVNDDYFVIVNVNYWTLMGEDKYYGHVVIVDDVGEATLTLQNPGPPPSPNQVVTKDLFLKAWYYPNEQLANFIAVGKKPF